MKFNYIVSIVLFSCSIVYAQQKEYKLVQYSENSDINVEQFEKYRYNELNSNDSIINLFTPINGECIVYFFIATFEGETKARKIETNHDYLILKVDPITNKILDGFLYTFEWVYLPWKVELYRVSELNVKIENEMRINKLKLKTFEIEYISFGKILKDDGIILLE